MLHEGRAIFSLDLHPAYSGSALEGVQLQLEARVLRFAARKVTLLVNWFDTVASLARERRQVYLNACYVPARWDEALAGVLLAYSNLQKLPSEVS